MQGDYVRAEAISQSALALFRELDDIQELIWVLISLGDCARDQHDVQHAERYFQEALSASRRVGNGMGMAYALDNLGRIAQTLGDQQGAFVLFSESLRAIQLLDAPTAEADILSRLAYIAYLCGDLPQATQQFRESLLYWWQAGTRIHLPPCIEGLAAIASAQGNAIGSARLFGAAAALRETIPLPIGQDQQRDYNRDLASCRVALTPEAFASAWNQGYTMPLAQAISDATESC
jgi:tetratricopeptide (TPR) repeat protein